MPAITIAYTDLVGSTKLQTMLHASDPNLPNDRPYIDQIQTPHRQRVRELLQQYNGREIDTMGDAFLVRFDDTMQAVSWAVAVQRSHYRNAIATPLGKLEVTIGLHTGAPERDPDYEHYLSGLAMSYGARVASLCSAGQILLSQATADTIRPILPDHLQLHLHGDRFYAKGIGAIPIYELLYDGNSARPIKQGNVPEENIASLEKFLGVNVSGIPNIGKQINITQVGTNNTQTNTFSNF